MKRSYPALCWGTDIEPESLRLAQGHDNVSSPMIGLVSHPYMDYDQDLFIERAAISAGLMLIKVFSDRSANKRTMLKDLPQNTSCTLADHP